MPEKNTADNAITLDATTDNLQTVLDFIDAILDENDCPMKTKLQIDIAVEEIFVNIANYAYASGTGKATVCAAVEDREVTITLTDSGTHFNPLLKEDPDITISAEERDIGGLGILMTKKSMDSVSYEYKDQQNALTLKKKF